MRVYPKVSKLAAWSENCKWYSSLPLGAVVSLFVSQSSEFCHHNPLCSFLSVVVYFVIDSVWKLLDTLTYFQQSLKRDVVSDTKLPGLFCLSLYHNILHSVIKVKGNWYLPLCMYGSLYHNVYGS
jgi:hypothetical protein